MPSQLDSVAASDRSQALAHIIRGMTVGLLGSVLGGGLGFIFSVVMARLLDQHEFGLLVLVLSFVLTGTTIGAFGADFATIRFVAAADSPGGKRGAMLTPLLLVIGPNVLGSAAIAILAKPIAVHLFDEPDLTGPLRAVALVMPLTVLALIFSAGLSGLEQVRGELVRKVVEQGGRLVFAPLALALGTGLVGAVLGMAVAAAVAAVGVGFFLLRSLPRGGHTQPVGVREVIAFSWPSTVARIAGEAWLLANVIILSLATASRTVALYGAALAIALLPSLINNAFAFRFAPAISRLWERGEHEELQDLLKGVTRWIAIFSVPLHAVAIALPASLLLVYGSGYDEATTALALMASAGLINALTGPLATSLLMTGLVRLEMVSNIVSAILLVALVSVMTPRLELTGAALGFLIYAVVLNGMKALFVYRRLHMSTVSPVLLGPVAAGAVASGVAILVDRLTDLGTSLVGGVVLAVVLIVSYVVILVRVIGISQADRAALSLALRAG